MYTNLCFYIHGITWHLPVAPFTFATERSTVWHVCAGPPVSMSITFGPLPARGYLAILSGPRSHKAPALQSIAQPSPAQPQTLDASMNFSKAVLGPSSFATWLLMCILRLAACRVCANVLPSRGGKPRSQAAFAVPPATLLENSFGSPC